MFKGCLKQSYVWEQWFKPTLNFTDEGQGEEGMNFPLSDLLVMLAYKRYQNKTQGAQLLRVCKLSVGSKFERLLLQLSETLEEIAHFFWTSKYSLGSI